MMSQGLLRIRFFVIILFILIIVSYSLYTARNYIKGPDLVISFPVDGYSTSSPAIHISGIALRVSSISINNRSIYMDEAGNWDEVLLLDSGYNIVNMHINDKFGRSSEKTIYIYRINQ